MTLLTFALVLAFAPAGASGPDDTFKAGLAAYDARRYTEAIELFERSYRQTGAPAVLFNIAQAERLLGDCRRAAATYRRFVAEAPTSPRRPLAESLIAEMGDCAGSAPAAAPAIPVGTEPSPRPVAPPPAASPSPAGADLRATPAAPARSPAGVESRSGRSRLPTLLLLAGAGVVGAAGGVLAIEASRAADETTRILRDGLPWDGAAIANDRDGRRAETWSRALLSTAVVLAAAGVIAWLVSSPPRGGS